MAGFTIPRAFVSMDPWSGTLLVGMPRGVTLPDGRDVGGYSLRKYADEEGKTDGVAKRESASRWTMASPARLQRGRGDDVEAVFVDAAVLADAVKTRLDSALRAVEDMDWTPDFGFDVEDSVRLDRCPECFDPDRIDRSAGLHAYYETEDGGWLRLTSRSWFDPNLGDFNQVCVDYVSAAGVMVSVKDTACLDAEPPGADPDEGLRSRRKGRRKRARGFRSDEHGRSDEHAGASRMRGPSPYETLQSRKFLLRHHR